MMPRAGDPVPSVTPAAVAVEGAADRPDGVLLVVLDLGDEEPGGSCVALRLGEECARALATDILAELRARRLYRARQRAEVQS